MIKTDVDANKDHIANMGTKLNMKIDGNKNKIDRVRMYRCSHNCSRYPEACPEADEASTDLVETNPTKANAIKSAIENGKLEELTMLLKEVDEKNPIITKFGVTDPITILHHAAYFGKLDIFKNISSDMTNINPKSISGTSKGATPLHYAALNGRLLVVKHITNCLTNIN